MPQSAMLESSGPAFVVIEVDSFPAPAPPKTMGSVAWCGDGTAVIRIRSGLPLRQKIHALQWCAGDLEKRLTPDGTSYWNGLKLVSENDAPDLSGSGHLAARPALSVAR